MAHRTETTVAECSLTSSVSARFLIGSHAMPAQRHSQPTQTSLGQGCSVTCHLHFWQNDQGLLRATAVTQGWNELRIRISTQSCLWREKTNPAPPAGIRTLNLSTTSPALLQNDVACYAPPGGPLCGHVKS